jgi:hypothetical protein
MIDLEEFVRSVASSELDDWPNVLLIGSGKDRQGSSEAGINRLLEALKSSGRTVIFDKSLTDPEATEIAKEVSCVNTTNITGSRPVCAMRRLDRLNRDTAPLLKWVISRENNWWICSGATVGGALSSISGAFLTARCPPLPDEERPAPIEFRVAKDVQVAWAAGEDMERIVEGFAALAAERLPRHDAIQRAAQLDVDIKRSLRPLLLSAIIEDAVSELLEYQMPS